MIKFKRSIPGWLFFIDDSGKIEFKEGTRYVEDLKKYLADGNEIEPQFTAEELSAKEAADAVQAIENQKTELLNLIKVNEYHLISRRFADDVPTWEAKLDEWAAQLEEVQAGKLVEIAEKPVF